MTVVAIALNGFRRLIRERSNIFFVFALPLLLILVLGLTVGSAAPRVGVLVDGERDADVDALIAELETVDGVVVRVLDDPVEAFDQLEREDITALVRVPADYGTLLAEGERVELTYAAIPTSGGYEAQGFVRSAVARIGATIRAERLVVAETGLVAAEAAVVVDAAAEQHTAVAIEVVDADGAPFIGANSVGFVAAQELVLFVFLISMVLAGALIESKRLGVTRRMLSTRASATEVVAGEALGRYLIAAAQAAVIIGFSALLFGLEWGSWAATFSIVAAFSLVATAAALLIGAIVRNESQSQAVGMSIGLALAALGGCMVPFEIFPEGLRSAAHVTPHAWAVDAFTEVLQRSGGLDDIVTELAVLLAYGVVLLAAATFALRRSIIDA